MEKDKLLEDMNEDERLEAFANHMCGIQENKELEKRGVGLKMLPRIN